MERISGKRNGLPEFFKRETGLSSPRTFSRRISSSQTLVEKLDLYGKLVGHGGCVNAIEFSSNGDYLVSGSDDKQIKLWEWTSNKLKVSYPSGHTDNVFQARFMPLSDDRKIITSGADGKVRLGEILDNGQVETKRLGKHHGRAHKLAVEPGSPYIFYSCGEDGLVQHFDLRCNSATKLFYCTGYSKMRNSSNKTRLNSIVIDPRNPNFFAAGGSDKYARVYDIRSYQMDGSLSRGIAVDTFCPSDLIDTNDVHITSLAYSRSSELLASYNDELIYLFQKNMGLGPFPLNVTSETLSSLEIPEVYSGHRNCKTVKGVNFFGPNDDYVLSGSDCGRIFIWKKKGAKLVRVMVGDRHIVNQLEPNPHLPVIATSGLEKNIKIWGPTSKDISPLPDDIDKVMEANKREREDHSRVSLTPDIIMHVLRLHRRQALAYIERNGGDPESDEDTENQFVMGLSDAESEEGGTDENPRECIIN